MIELRTTIISLLYNTAFVELEGGPAGIEGYSEGLLPQLGLHIFDGALDSSVLLDVGHGGICLVSTCVLLCVVGVVGVGHGALILNEVLSEAHPAA